MSDSFAYFSENPPRRCRDDMHWMTKVRELPKPGLVLCKIHQRLTHFNSIYRIINCAPKEPKKRSQRVRYVAMNVSTMNPTFADAFICVLHSLDYQWLPPQFLFYIYSILIVPPKSPRKEQQRGTPPPWKIKDCKWHCRRPSLTLLLLHSLDSRVRYQCYCQLRDYCCWLWLGWLMCLC